MFIGRKEEYCKCSKTNEMKGDLAQRWTIEGCFLDHHSPHHPQSDKIGLPIRGIRNLSPAACYATWIPYPGIRH